MIEMVSLGFNPKNTTYIIREKYSTKIE